MSPKNWMEILKANIAAEGQNKTALKLGYSPTTISLVMSGRYLGKTDKVAERVIKILATVHCPYLNQQLDMQVCTDTAQGQIPSQNPIKMDHWRACQNCTFNSQNRSKK